MDLLPISIINDLSAEALEYDWYRAHRPVILKNHTQSWNARNIWTLAYLRSVIGEAEVGLYESSMNDPRAPVNAATMTMRFSQYVDLIEHEQTDLRIFLLNLAKVAPALLADIERPPITRGWLKSLPMLFVGGANSRVFLHYDIDMSHVFHTQFGGLKRAILFPPESSAAIYKIPMSVRSFMSLDPESPDYQTFPALSQVQGWAATLEHGDMLYMPPGWWHHMRYIENGFGLSQRCLPTSSVLLAKALWNIFAVKPAESLLRKIGGASWALWKERVAMKRGERCLKQAESA